MTSRCALHYDIKAFMSTCLQAINHLLLHYSAFVQQCLQRAPALSAGSAFIVQTGELALLLGCCFCHQRAEFLQDNSANNALKLLLTCHSALM